MPGGISGPTQVDLNVRFGRLRRAWRSPYWFKPAIALAALMVGFSMLLSSALNWQYRADRAEAFDVQQQEVVALRNELTCRAQDSAPATRIEGEITRIGWRALVTWAETGDSGDPRVTEAAANIRRLYQELGPALRARAEAIESCNYINEQQGE